MSKPRINLLPYRQERRAQKQREFCVMTVIAAVVGLVIAGFGSLILNERLDNQNARNQLLTTEIAKLDSQIKEIDKIRAAIHEAVLRKKAVEELQNNRTVAVHLFDELIRQLPEGVYLKAEKQKGYLVTVDGYAQSNAHISAFMRNIEGSDWLENPKLVVSRLVTITEKTPGQRVAGKKNRTVIRHDRQAFEFTMNFTIRTTAKKHPIVAPGSPLVVPLPAATPAAPAKPAAAKTAMLDEGDRSWN
jgi:type IV pilus assembly protein PilN